ncbi:hypothetical protein NDU88_004590 [Pleurodeles waltl]|uniref:Uncharacterized protein n=1 Tax=Pleurodeles waltl TaxID=8319 RepID=A0AAV7LJ26_PLEWA|nr:hypothetical protein NDU88_004590 [Pleurodeles waltl]
MKSIPDPKSLLSVPNHEQPDRYLQDWFPVIIKADEQPGTEEEVESGVSRSPTRTLNNPTVPGEEPDTNTADEAVTVTAGKCMTTPPIQRAQENTDETDLDLEAGNMTPGPLMSGSWPHWSAESVQRRQRPIQSASEEDITSEQFLGLEASLLQSHRAAK